MWPVRIFLGKKEGIETEPLLRKYIFFKKSKNTVQEK